MTLTTLAARPVVWIGLLLVAAIAFMPATAPWFHAWYPELGTPVYQRASFFTLTMSHVALVGLSSAIVAVVGIAAGAFVTTAPGREFAGIVDRIVAIGQTFPPAAVLAVAVPATGYGAVPTLIALVAYGVLPVVETTVTGLAGVPDSVRQAADGVGFTPFGRLARGIADRPAGDPDRTSHRRRHQYRHRHDRLDGRALTLGSPIIEGLSGSNPAFVVQGAIVVALLAVFIDQLFEEAERVATRHRRRCDSAAYTEPNIDANLMVSRREPRANSHRI